MRELSHLLEIWVGSLGNEHAEFIRSEGLGIAARFRKHAAHVGIGGVLHHADGFIPVVLVDYIGKSMAEHCFSVGIGLEFFSYSFFHHLSHLSAMLWEMRIAQKFGPHIVQKRSSASGASRRDSR